MRSLVSNLAEQIILHLQVSALETLEGGRLLRESCRVRGAARDDGEQVRVDGFAADFVQTLEAFRGFRQRFGVTIDRGHRTQ